MLRFSSPRLSPRLVLVYAASRFGQPFQERREYAHVGSGPVNVPSKTGISYVHVGHKNIAVFDAPEKADRIETLHTLTQQL
jgi:hypothetical protein